MRKRFNPLTGTYNITPDKVADLTDFATHNHQGGSGALIAEAAMSLSDVTTLDASITKHGFCPKAPNDATKFLDGTANYDTVKDSDLSTSDITTNDVTVSKHGFVPKAPNDVTKFLRGDASWAAVSGGHTIDNEGVALTQRTNLDFIGALVAATDDAVNDKTKVTISTPTLEQARTAGATLAGNIDFAGFEAVAMVCDNGATLPSTPVTGQWFLHTPTGRQVLMMYTGSEWEGIMSLGTTTIYVDPIGFDGPDSGFGTGTDAFSSIQYAFNSIGDIYCGDVNIYVAAGTYSESVVIQGKMPCGNYRINLIGTWTNSLTDITASSGAARTSATATGSITKTGAGWTANAYQGLMLYTTSGTGSGQYRPILSNTTDTIYVEAWSTTPNNTTHFDVYDWATVVSSSGTAFDIVNSANISVKNMNLVGRVYPRLYSANITVDNCEIVAGGAHGVYNVNSYVTMNSCYVHGINGVGIQTLAGSSLILDCWFQSCTANGIMHNGGNETYLYRCRIDASTSHGVYSANKGTIIFTVQKSSVVNHTTATKYGCYAEYFGQLQNVSTNAYFNGNTVGDYYPATGAANNNWNNS